MPRIDIIARRIVLALTRTAAVPRDRDGNVSGAFCIGLLAGLALSVAALHSATKAQHDLVLAFTLYPVTAPAGQLAVLAVAIVVLVGFLLWCKRATSDSFFRGALAGTGPVLSFDIVWVHWIFGLHH